MSDVEAVAHDFCALMVEGRFADAGDKYWAPNISSIEPADLPEGIPATVSGIEAVRAKRDHWFGANEIREFLLEGPFVTGNQFAAVIEMLIVPNAGNEPFRAREVGLFTVQDGRVTEERYFY